MKNTLILLTFLFSSSALLAQIDAKINPIGSIFGSPDLSVEISPAEKFGVEGAVGMNFGGIGGFNLSGFDFERRGITGFVAGKYYFNEDRGMDNLSIGLYLKGKNVNYNAKLMEDVDQNFDRNKMAIGFIASQKWVSENNLVFEIDLGVGRNIVNRFNYDNESKSSVNVSKIPFLNIDGIFRIAVGYRFGGNSSY